VLKTDVNSLKTDVKNLDKILKKLEINPTRQSLGKTNSLKLDSPNLKGCEIAFSGSHILFLFRRPNT
ncbi:MAG: hypothetical protein II642_07535, partial [Firmicutes bacterium]|nr:hypothetical protein [Bacillota bacterium]